MSGHYTHLRWRRQQRFLTHSDAHIKSWLFDTGSLTARLISHCNADFRVKVLSVKRATPTPDEVAALGLRPRNQALIRQVLLCCGDFPVVYARTVIPLSSLRGALRGLVLLGNKPLGAVLFADKSMRRKSLEVTSLTELHKCYRWTQHKGSERIWGRRSLFSLKNKELLVSEFFLPTLFSPPCD
ncbi:Chorismate--pyruvate lyase [hydrothermal vent metagenome]|uniref:Chorismate--pyruvate lyase n=1 Tax=hydrothermal vent metagenome TaxID=652676 RepID=A0A3B0X8K7_9ZZZZ